MKRKNAVVGTKVFHKEYGRKGVIVALTKDGLGDGMYIVEWKGAGIGAYYAGDLKKAEKVK